MRVGLRGKKQNIEEMIFLMYWSGQYGMLKSLYFNCKGDHFKRKQIRSYFVVSVGTNVRILSTFISEWGTLLKAANHVCLWVCAENISLQIY